MSQIDSNGKLAIELKEKETECNALAIEIGKVKQKAISNQNVQNKIDAVLQSIENHGFDRPEKAIAFNIKTIETNLEDLKQQISEFEKQKEAELKLQASFTKYVIFLILLFKQLLMSKRFILTVK